MYSLAILTALSAAALAAPAKLDARQATSYVSYYGNGAPGAPPAFPGSEEWVDFSTLWSSYSQIIANSCAEYQQPLNSAEETQQLQDAINSVANGAGVDPRFVLAVVLQESRGCVRVPTTDFTGQGGNRNPGLMQSFNGQGTCNDQGVVQNPCPQATIELMIRDGTTGTGPGSNNLQTNLNGDNGPQSTYRAARVYNSGSVASSGDLSDPASAGTPSYSSDIANRLRGYVFTGSEFVPQ